MMHDEIKAHMLAEHGNICGFTGDQCHGGWGVVDNLGNGGWFKKFWVYQITKH